MLLPPLYKLVVEAVGDITGGDLIFFRGGPSSGPESKYFGILKMQTSADKSSD